MYFLSMIWNWAFICKEKLFFYLKFSYIIYEWPFSTAGAAASKHHHHTVMSEHSRNCFVYQEWDKKYEMGEIHKRTKCNFRKLQSFKTRNECKLL